MTAQTLPVLQIRWLIRRDLEQVLALDRQCFFDCWSEETYLTTLRQRNCIAMVVELNDHTIAGVMVYELHKGRIELLRLFVGNEFQNRGIGSAMVGKLIHKLGEQGRNVVAINVNEWEIDAHLWLAERQFRGFPNGDEIRFEFRLEEP